MTDEELQLLLKFVVIINGNKTNNNFTYSSFRNIQL